ncbi:hypothetical protein MJI95_35180, partial [Salmonella enterica subsp. enterica serovar Kentucky]|nr:hypothetical protein [Salmonella enterica subsp. enterica serovar Kentucky]
MWKVRCVTNDRESSRADNIQSQLGLQPYEAISQAMHNFTDMRDENSHDEIWLVEHYPVFTQG